MPWSLRLRRLAAGCAPALALAACGPPPAPPQPIAFDHSRHAAQGIGCLECHEGAARGAQAGLPPLAACASCHFTRSPEHPEVQKVLRHFLDREPILWRKVNVMPASALVRFPHRAHLRAGIDCGQCHGDVAAMTVARRVVATADMGFCLDCHRESGASTDCLSCHR